MNNPYHLHTIMMPTRRIGNTLFVDPRTIAEHARLCRITVGDILTVLSSEAKPEDTIPRWRVMGKVELQRCVVFVITDADES